MKIGSTDAPPGIAPGDCARQPPICSFGDLALGRGFELSEPSALEGNN